MAKLPNDLVHFLYYFVTHKAHHRGQIVLTDRALGDPFERKRNYLGCGIGRNGPVSEIRGLDVKSHRNLNRL